MNNLLLKLRQLLHLTVDKKRAAAIARQALASTAKCELEIFAEKPENIILYNQPTEPCWYIIAPWNDGLDGKILRSSHLIVISKISGQILYDGSANDEG